MFEFVVITDTLKLYTQNLQFDCVLNVKVLNIFMVFEFVCSRSFHCNSKHCCLPPFQLIEGFIKLIIEDL